MSCDQALEPRTIARSEDPATGLTRIGQLVSQTSVRLGLLLLACLVPRVVVACKLSAVSDDGFSYLHVADALERGRLAQALEYLNLNVYPVALVGLHKLGLEWTTAGKLWGVLMATAIVLPLFDWLRRMFDERIATAGVFLYAVHPKLIEYSVEPIREATFWFFFVVGLNFFWRAFEERRWWQFATAGAALVPLPCILCASKAGFCSPPWPCGRLRVSWWRCAGRTTAVGPWAFSPLPGHDTAVVVGDERHPVGALSDVGIRSTQPVRRCRRVGAPDGVSGRAETADSRSCPCAAVRPRDATADRGRLNSDGGPWERRTRAKRANGLASAPPSDRICPDGRRPVCWVPGVDWALEFVGQRLVRSPSGLVARLDRGNFGRHLDSTGSRGRNERPLFSDVGLYRRGIRGRRVFDGDAIGCEPLQPGNRRVATTVSAAAALVPVCLLAARVDAIVFELDTPAVALEQAKLGRWTQLQTGPDPASRAVSDFQAVRPAYFAAGGMPEVVKYDEFFNKAILTAIRPTCWLSIRARLHARAAPHILWSTRPI